METCKTTLETLVAAAICHDANTLGNNSGASYTSRFVFENKYSFEAYCTNDKHVCIQFCEVDGNKSKVLIGHCLNIMHNELLAPIYAQFLWAGFESLLYSNPNLSRIDKAAFISSLLNYKEDELVDRANMLIEKVFHTTEEYEIRGSGVSCFISKEYGPVYLNQECLEYYADAIHALPEEIQKQVKQYSNVAFAKDNKQLSRLSGLTIQDIRQSATKAKLILLDKVLDIVDPDCFGWALDTYRAIDEAYKERCASVADYNESNAEHYKACIEHFKAMDIEAIVEVDGSVSVAEELYNWQAQRGVSFDLQTLALIFYELNIYSDVEFADELLRDSAICEVIHLAYVAPSSYNY